MERIVHTYVVSRKGDLAQVHVDSRESWYHVRTELETLRRTGDLVTEHLQLGKATTPSAYCLIERHELAAVLWDAQHPSVMTSIRSMSADFPDWAAEFNESDASIRAEGVFRQALKCGAIDEVPWIHASSVGGWSRRSRKRRRERRKPLDSGWVDAAACSPGGPPKLTSSQGTMPSIIDRLTGLREQIATAQVQVDEMAGFTG